MQLEGSSSGQSTACSVAPGSIPRRRSTREEALEQASKEPDQVALPFAEAGEPDILSPPLTTPPALQAPRPLRSDFLSLLCPSKHSRLSLSRRTAG